MNRIRILIFMLIASMLLSFAACGENSLPQGEGSDKDATTTAGGTGTENTPDGGVVYKLPAGADSPYALYTTVIDCLNNGFHYDDLNDVFDMNLYIVFYTKATSADSNFTLGMKYDESCALIAKLTNIARSDMPLDANGEFEDDLIDYYQFKTAFPEDMQSRINENHDDFEGFIEDLYVLIYVHDRDDGKNPFGAEQTTWEKKSESELEIEKYDTDRYEDLYANFPQVYEMEIGSYREGMDIHTIGIIYAKIGSSYYFLGFSEVYGSAAEG